MFVYYHACLTRKWTSVAPSHRGFLTPWRAVSSGWFSRHGSILQAAVWKHCSPCLLPHFSTFPKLKRTPALLQQNRARGGRGSVVRGRCGYRSFLHSHSLLVYLTRHILPHLTLFFTRAVCRRVRTPWVPSCAPSSPWARGVFCRFNFVRHYPYP